MISLAADPLRVPANHEPALMWNVPGSVLSVRAGERAMLAVEGADPDLDEAGSVEPVQLHAEWVLGADEAAPEWSARTYWATGLSAEPRLLLTLSPPYEALPGRHTLLVGATDARGLTALRTLSVEVLAAEAPRWRAGRGGVRRGRSRRGDVGGPGLGGGRQDADHAAGGRRAAVGRAGAGVRGRD